MTDHAEYKSVTRFWKPDGKPPQDRGDMDTDVQASRTSSVRFINTELPYALICVHAFATAHADAPVMAADYPEESETYGVQVRTEFVICGNPDDADATAEWSGDVTEWFPGKPVTIGDAKRIAEHVGRWYAAGTLRPALWDGQAWDGDANRPKH